MQGLDAILSYPIHKIKIYQFIVYVWTDELQNPGRIGGSRSRIRKPLAIVRTSKYT